MADRTYDLVAYIGEFSPLTPTRASLFSEAGLSYAQTGIAKLAYQFLIELFTDAGSIPYFPERGALFSYDLMAGRFRTQMDVRISFAEAENRIRESLNASLAGAPDDELLASATLSSVTIEAGRVILRIVITSVAGTNAKLILPVAVAP